MTGWPYPGDSPLARARRVAQAYRAALDATAPDTCRALDTQLTGWGETWLTPTPVIYDLDDWVGPADAAALAYVRTAHLRVWRARGRITGRQTADGTWQYRVRDVLDLAATTRHRTRKATR